MGAKKESRKSHRYADVSQTSKGVGYLAPRTSKMILNRDQINEFAGICIRSFLLRDSSNKKERSLNGLG